MEGSKPLISDELALALRQARKEIEHRRLAAPTLERIVSLLEALPPEDAVRADAQIAYAAGLFGTPVQSLGHLLLFGQRPLVPDLPGAEHLFVFHRNGYAREKALNRFSGGLRSPIFVAAVACRLNDWVPQVRNAALRCAERTFPLTEPDVIAEASIALLDRQHSWRRWSAEAAVLDQTMARPDVAGCLLERIAGSRNGPMASALRNLLRRPGFDHGLGELATKAVQPAVRAIAARTLVRGKASWPAGHRRQWLDKPNGIFRRVTNHNERPLSPEPPRETFVAIAARDRSSSVRRIAAGALVEFGESLSNLDEMMNLLAADRSPAIRERVDFVARDLVAKRERGGKAP